MEAFILGLALDGFLMHLTFVVSLFSSAYRYGHRGDPKIVKVSLRELISLYISLVFSLEGMAYFSSLFGFFFASTERDGGKHGYNIVGS